MTNDLVERLRKRAEIRRGIDTRKSVQEGKPDRLADLLEEAAQVLEDLTCHQPIDGSCVGFTTVLVENDDNEFARYLASYIIDGIYKFSFVSEIEHPFLENLIKEFIKELP